MMNDFLGWTGIVFGLLITTIICLQNRDIFWPILVAFGVRTLAALFHYYIAPLPDGGYDAVTFERLAWEWGQDGFSSAITHFQGINAYFYPWLMSLLYGLTDRSLLLLQSVNVTVGVLTIYAGWRLAYLLWDRRAAYKTAWLLALFPTLVQYSALPMREVWVVLLFIIGLISVVQWARRGGIVPIFAGNLAFIGATFFHGGLFIALLGFLGLIGFSSARLWLQGLSKGRLRILSSFGLILVSMGLGFYILSGISLPKLGTPSDLIDLSRLISRAEYFTTLESASARYPGWTVPHSPVDLLWAVPLRGVYLLFSPFPWDLKSPQHLVGLVDGIFYMALVFFAWKNRKNIVTDKGAKAVFLITILLTAAFGMGTGNFGTALRHRAKFVVAIIVLASPKLPFISIKKSKNRKPNIPHKEKPQQGAIEKDGQSP